jgi:DNA-binding CsgD family transcriptional regulator
VTTDAYYATHQGYQIEEMLSEVYGVEQRDFLAEGSFKQYRDYEEFRAHPSYSELMENHPPFLMGLHADTVKNHYGYLRVRDIFLSAVPPRFLFRPNEQAVLELALRGIPDSEIASMLGFSLWTIKKRWQRIYDRVERVDRGLIAKSDGAIDNPGRRRRRLLDYLRSHPEELRPFEA